MTRKTAESYSAVFKYIEEKLHFKFKPVEFMTDYEDGMRLAIKRRWPNAIIKGCWFHFCRAINKRYLKLGLNRIKNKHSRRICRMLMSIPLLPPHLIHEGFEAINKFARKHRLFKRFASLFSYIQRYWLGQVKFIHPICYPLKYLKKGEFSE